LSELIFDVETNGLEDSTKIHSIVTLDLSTKVRSSFHDHQDRDKTTGTILDGLDLLASADLLIGHNAQVFDIPIIRKIFPRWRFERKIRDTLRISRLIYTHLTEEDHARFRHDPRFPARLIGSHSLEAWGYRLGVMKDGFGRTADWSEWSAQMQRYCEQDVLVTLALWGHFNRLSYSERSIELEHDFQEAIAEMERTGVCFNEGKAQRLYSTLAAKRNEIREELTKIFPPTIVQLKTKTKEIPFNPASRVQIADRLMRLGWKPAKRTPTGIPQVDETTLEGLPYPEAKKLAEFFLLQKRIGQVAEGSQAWMKLVTKKGRIHGSINTNGAVTGRCTHSSPNLAQVPRVGSLYGKECRELFEPAPGKVLIGADASGLELRMLSHYLAAFDQGEYGRTLLEGDVHTFNQGVFGLPPGKEGRNSAKTGIYALIYGAGDEKLGSSLGLLEPASEAEAQASVLSKRNKYIAGKMKSEGSLTKETLANIKRGQWARDRMFQKIPAYARLVESIAATLKKRPWLNGLDGRKLHIRSAHSALNTVLQSAGALVVKLGTVLMVREFPKYDARLLLHVHDEVQIESPPEHAETIGKIAVEAFRQAGRAFNLRIPTDGEFKIGTNWAETH
jgi:DNA polymerase I-like protein with 3'-5' exonuclease and polymerase domains